jgi:hypothetical protein
MMAMPSRRRFLKLAGGAAALGAMELLFPGEAAATNLMALMSGLNPLTTSSYRVSVFGPTSLLVQGQRITITGQVLNSNGVPYANQMVGVTDGVGRMCAQTRTNNLGNFNYQTTVQSADASIVWFVVNGNIYPFGFQSVTDLYTRRTNSLNITALAFRNASPSNVLSTTTVDSNGRQYIHHINRNALVTTIRTLQSHVVVTWYGGGSFNVGAGLGGGSISVTLDNNRVATTTYTAGGLVALRGSVYITQGNLGACWAPGGDLGTTPISLSGEVDLCYGTDGPSLGASGSLGGLTGGFSVRLRTT